MPKYLVIVESPAKAKTIARYLGKDYAVQASVGHVRDLPPRKLAVDVEHGFQPTYQLIKGKGEVVEQIRNAAQKTDTVYLATDPDREGEAIAWHVVESADIDERKTRRVSFHEITKAAILEAISHPRDLDRHLIDAQQARRVLDRLVGYQISPLLSKNLRRALSAGRVQSVALRLVVDREREIRAFVPEEYWTLDAELQRRTKEKERFVARLFKVKGKKPELGKREDVDRVLDALKGATYTITQVKKGTRRQNPSPPFVTSTMQAEAGRKLRFSPRKTMTVAQQLYEGIDLGGERVGLITYMRTDSTHVAPEAQQEAREFIGKKWGKEFLPAQPPVYRAKVALAQEAHEAIRPTSVMREPDALRGQLTSDQARLYTLIWQRFVASQMKPALFDTLTVDVTAAQDYLFRATGQVMIFPGFTILYTEGRDDEKDEKTQILPSLVEGEVVDLIKLLPEQHFTEPPPRYTEPTLIKALEQNGVGRPSTYASIVGVIQERGYVSKDKGRLFPTDLGMIVCDVLMDTFANIMDVGYTASMEAQLDKVAGGDLDYVGMLSDFYRDFSPRLSEAKQEMPGAVEQAMQQGVSPELSQRTCPECGKPLAVRVSEAGRFLGCTGYPDCRYTLHLGEEGQPQEAAEQFAEGETCELCGGRMKIVTHGKSRFLGCEHYPKCKHTRPILSDQIKQLATVTPCPQCSRPSLEPKKGRFGEYLHCPDCRVNFSLSKLGLGKGGRKGGGQAAAPVETVDIACPECSHRPMEKRVGRYGPYYRCPACKKNISERKMAAQQGAQSSQDSTPSNEGESHDAT